MDYIKDKLNAIREPKEQTLLKTFIFALLSLMFGVALGLFSKWLDNLAVDNTIWWQQIIGQFDLGNFFSDIAIWLLLALFIATYSASPLRASMNVFLFFLGMCLSYHLYTIVFSGFNPSSYMMIWYGITIISPLLAILCWYAKGKGICATVLDIGIIAIFFLSCFAIGWIYIDLKGPLYLLVFILMMMTIYRSPRDSIITFIAGLVLAFLLNPFWPFK